MTDIMTYMSNEVRNQLCRVPEYAARLAANDIIWMKNRAEFIATGFGGAFINMDALAVMRTQLGGGTFKAYIEFVKDFTDAKKRLMGRNADAAVILAAILDSHFIMALKDHSLLKEKIRLIFEMAVWPTAEEIAPQFPTISRHWRQLKERGTSRMDS